MGKARPEPLIILASSNHTHTMILLHGHGSNADRFTFDPSTPNKLGILECRGSSGKTLPQLLPNMKFVLPTAPLRRSTARNRATMNIWFDNSSFEGPFKPEEIQVEGLAANFNYVCELVRMEAQILSPAKIFLDGLSQGCAMALHVLLGFAAERPCSNIRLGGFIGMSGWLPFQNAVTDILSTRGPEKDEDGLENPFASENEGGADLHKDGLGFQVAQFIREDVMGDLPCDKELLIYRCTPIFLGHGDHDDVVELDYAKNAMASLRYMGLDICWKVYEQQGHWYSTKCLIQ
jgi:predicted esterase